MIVIKWFISYVYKMKFMQFNMLVCIWLNGCNIELQLIWVIYWDVNKICIEEFDEL